MRPQARAHLADLPAVVHGSIGDTELASIGLTRDDVIDFSVNVNPLGPSPAVTAAVRSAVWTHYPDDRAEALRRALARWNGVAENRVVVGNGSAELIWLIALAFLDPGAPVVVVGPTFGEYVRAARIAGGVIYECRASDVDDFAVNVSTVVDLVRSLNARIVFLCNPNNPTGRWLPPGDIEALVSRTPGTLVVVDEAYLQFVDEPPEPAPLLAYPNVVLLRSLTKDCALAGLRLGYLLADEEVCRGIDRVRPPWNVNAVAQAAGLAAISDEVHLARARSEVRRARAFLLGKLSALGFRVIPPSANFLLVEVGDAAAWRSLLLRQGLVVRDCHSFGLPRYVRIGVRPLPDCERLIAAFEEIVARQLPIASTSAC